MDRVKYSIAARVYTKPSYIKIIQSGLREPFPDCVCVCVGGGERRFSIGRRNKYTAVGTTGKNVFATVAVIETISALFPYAPETNNNLRESVTGNEMFSAF